MTTITLKQNENAEITKFMIQGHTGYGTKGNDIVCAAISVLSQNTVNCLQDILDVNITIDSTIPLLMCEIPEIPNCSVFQRLQANLLLNSMIKGLQSVAAQYPELVVIE